MHRLTEVRVINWHGYQDEVVRIDGDTLITGQNGSGKTTVVDAIQYALVADQRLVRFNKANENSRRTLVGYCRWHVSAEEQGGRGRGTYQRGACTSYIALRFDDPERPGHAFVCAVIMEAGDGDSLVSQHHLIVPGARVEDLPFVVDDAPLSSIEFRREAAERGWKTILDASGYRVQLRHRLGMLPESFHRLIVKALDFKPIGVVRQFIMSFLLEERPVETDALLRNVENYQRLEAEANAAAIRIAALHEILTSHGQFERARDEHAHMEYMVTRAKADVAEEAVNTIHAENEARSAAIADLEIEVARHKKREEELGRDHERVISALAGAPAHQQRVLLSGELERAASASKEAEEATVKASRIREQMLRTLAHVTSDESVRHRRVVPAWFADDPFADDDRAARSREFLDGSGDPDGRRARSWRTALAAATPAYSNGNRVAGERIGELNKLAASLHEERERLQQGQVTYAKEVEALLHLLNARLGTIEPIRPLCEQIEISDMEWANAAEAMLGGDRFALVVPPEHYERAVQLYHRHKDGYQLPGRGSVPLHGVRVIDMRGVLRDMERGRVRRPGSLAERIDAESELARAYVDYRIGDVICVQRVIDLRNHARAVTADVMAHQGHATFRVPPHVYERHFIGRASQTRRIEQIIRDLGRIQAEVDRITPIKEFFVAALRLCDESRLALDAYLGLAQTGADLEHRRQRERELMHQIEILDRDPELQRHVAERDRLKEIIQANREGLEKYVGQAGQLRATIDAEEKRIPGLANEAASARADLAERCAAIRPDRVADYAARYEERRNLEGIAPIVIAATYENQRKNRETQVANCRQQLGRLEDKYATAYGMEPPEHAEDVDRYAVELGRWEESELPAYRESIAEVRKEARRQLVEDYLYRLYDSFRMLQDQFRDMDTALKADAANAHWGRYRFSWTPLTQYRGLYDLVMQVGISGRDSLFDTDAAREEFSEELDRLADSLLRSNVQAAEESVLRDYREFFDYDLILRRTDGREESFKNVTGAGSGGENQVPYYIAIFSALYQMYRQMSRDGRPTCGLVLLDEAFSKMDEIRIESVLGLARHFGLQLVMVTPGDKVATIVPRVETTILVERDQRRSDSVPTTRRFNKEMLSEALGEIERQGALAPATA